MHPHPNSYTFSKQLAEVISNDLGKELPISVARPSIGKAILYHKIFLKFLKITLVVNVYRIGINCFIFCFNLFVSLIIHFLLIPRLGNFYLFSTSNVKRSYTWLGRFPERPHWSNCRN